MRHLTYQTLFFFLLHPLLVFASEAMRPNIVLIMADDMGYSDIGCYGGEIETPNLDKLAAGGLRFTQFYNNAKCAPTRASLLTGQYSQHTGVHDGPVKMRNCVTLAEVLRSAGYRTLMAGKWHAEELPVDRGFDRYYGLADGCCNYFNPGERREGEAMPAEKNFPRKWAEDGNVLRPYTPTDKDFYTTDAFTDQAVKYLEEYAKEETPFFLYLAYTAPHYPLHAPEEDIQKYAGKYLRGWDLLREERYALMQDMGLLQKHWRLSPRESRIPAWTDVTDAAAWKLGNYSPQLKSEWVTDPKWWDRAMATYAAMVDRMDRNIGRIVSKLEEQNKLDNTLIFFLSDNGACAEIRHTGSDSIGTMDEYHTVDPPWACLQNTPFRMYKRHTYEGGIATPLIAHWPGNIAPNTITHQVAHIMDFMPTILELSGAAYPGEHNGENVNPHNGKTLLPILQGREREAHEALYWNFGPAKAVRMGEWKAVKEGDAPWELYNLDADRTELNNLAQKQSERTEEMAQTWEKWRLNWGKNTQ